MFGNDQDFEKAFRTFLKTVFGRVRGLEECEMMEGIKWRRSNLFFAYNAVGFSTIK